MRLPSRENSRKKKSRATSQMQKKWDGHNRDELMSLREECRLKFKL